VAKDLNRALCEAKNTRSFTNIPLTHLLFLTHMLFGGVVLILCSGLRGDAKTFSTILDLSNRITGMQRNKSKYTLSTHLMDLKEVFF
jgi:hypothetical protein